MKALITLGVVALIVLGIVLIAWIVTRSRNVRAELDSAIENNTKWWREVVRYRDWVAETYALAIASQDIDPFAAIVAGRIREFHNNKEGISS
jgi:hypothetical protein